MIKNKLYLELIDMNEKINDAEKVLRNLHELRREMRIRYNLDKCNHDFGEVFIGEYMCIHCGAKQLFCK